ncbi:MAG: exodeoxyribonuclease VII large subunit, partial [Acidimicrobiales bacterium]
VLGRAAGRFAAEGRHLEVLSPRRTLGRGYAVVAGPDGSVLRRASSVRAGDAVTVRLSAGSLVATVTEVRDG